MIYSLNGVRYIESKSIGILHFRALPVLEDIKMQYL
jgi:hypothetical protein